jgi:autophagy-related protein 11
LREQQVQQMALETACGNINFYYKIIDHAFSDFLKHFGRQHKQHSDLLVNFERYLERLKACKLHPSLQSETRKSLLDCVKQASLRKWAEDCAFSHKQFGAKVTELKIVYVDLQHNVQSLFSLPPVVNLQDLEDTVEDHVRFTEEQASIIQSLRSVSSPLEYHS